MNLKFTINWRLTLFFCGFFPLLMTLGFWQLDRAIQKESILSTSSDKASSQRQDYLLLINKQQGLRNDLQYSPVYVVGEFLEKFWLLEGRQRYGQVGYEVLAALAIGQNRTLLVNLGWIKADSRREVLPSVHLPKNSVRIEGELYFPQNSNLIDETKNSVDVWPHRILEIEFDELSKQSGYSLEPLIIRIDQYDAFAFDAVWPRINMKPEKHRAYAVQWFAMAFALFVLWFYTNTNIARLIKK